MGPPPPWEFEEVTTTSDRTHTPVENKNDGETKACILVVDDDHHMQKLISYNLRNSGYAVEACQQGEEALARVEKGGIDLVLLDVMMPGIGGLETLKRMSRASIHAENRDNVSAQP